MQSQDDGPTVRAAVVGSPIAHSLSPVLHSAGYAELGLANWSYQAVELAESEFAAWFGGLGPHWRGVSVTMPLKRVVMPCMTRITPLARAVGAVNTVTWDADRQSVGDNTDVYGIVEAMRSAGLRSPRKACVIGAGATASSAIAALAGLGCADVVLLARSPERAGEALAVAQRFAVRARVSTLDDLRPVLVADAVVTTLPSGPAGELAQTLPAPRRGDRFGVLLDVSYHPWPTAMASAWQAAGGVAVGGFEMLLHQAARQFTMMTGHPAPLDAMRLAGEKALADR